MVIRTSALALSVFLASACTETAPAERDLPQEMETRCLASLQGEAAFAASGDFCACVGEAVKESGVTPDVFDKYVSDEESDWIMQLSPEDQAAALELALSMFVCSQAYGPDETEMPQAG